MTRPFLVVLSLLVAAILFVALQFARRPALAAADNPPSPIQSYSSSKVVFAPSKPPRLTRVPIRVPGLDITQTVLPKHPPEWISLSHESPYSGSGACALDSMGPVLVLRHYLADKQWASLTAPDHKGSILLRYEIIDATSQQFPYPFPELAQSKPSPYLVTAILYWADLTPEDRAAPLATYRRREIDASGNLTSFVGQYGPAMTRVRAEWMEYGVSPDEAHWTPKGERRVMAGEAGWTVDEHPRLAGEGASTCGSTTNLVPVYDLSISQPTG